MKLRISIIIYVFLLFCIIFVDQGYAENSNDHQKGFLQKIKKSFNIFRLNQDDDSCKSRRLSENTIFENSGVENKGLTVPQLDKKPILGQSPSLKDLDSSPDYYYNERYYGLNQKDKGFYPYGDPQADFSEPGYYYNERYFLSNQKKKSSSFAPQTSTPESRHDDNKRYDEMDQEDTEDRKGLSPFLELKEFEESVRISYQNDPNRKSSFFEGYGYEPGYDDNKHYDEMDPIDTDASKGWSPSLEQKNFEESLRIFYQNDPDRKNSSFEGYGKKSEQKDKSAFFDNSEYQQLAEWVKNFDYGVIVGTDEKPRYYMETVFPLYESADEEQMFFTHDRIAVQGDQGGTFSAGLGYRKLFRDKSVLAGVNSFFDYADKHRHYRSGTGLELITPAYEARANHYWAHSPKRETARDSGYISYEKAVSGYDVEFGGPVPKTSWFKLFGGYSAYDKKHAQDEEGWTARAEISPNKFTKLNFRIFDDKSGEQEYSMEGLVSLKFDSFNPKDIWEQIDRDKMKQRETDGEQEQQNDEGDLSKLMLARVERNFDIKTEQWQEAYIVPVPVGSGGDIQIQLIWPLSNNNDLDLHLNLPVGSGTPTHVYFAQKQSFIGAELFAELDVDDIPLTEGPATHPGRDHVENIFVTEGMVVSGLYSPYVHVYSFSSVVTITVNVFVNGQFQNTYSTTFTADEQIFNLPDIVIP